MSISIYDANMMQKKSEKDVREEKFLIKLYMVALILCGTTLRFDGLFY